MSQNHRLGNQVGGGPLMHSCANSRAAENAPGGWADPKAALVTALKSDCAYTSTARQAVTSGRDVVCVVATSAAQHEVAIIIYGRVVGHVRRAIHGYPDTWPWPGSIVRGSIANHCAPLPGLNSGGSGAGHIVAGYDPGSGNSGPATGRARDVEYRIALHDPRGGYPNDAGADGAEDAQSLNYRAAIRVKTYSDTET